jgi:hypothetical protein
MSIVGALDDAFSYLTCATAYPKDPVMVIHQNTSGPVNE